jgi:hypothetical protein
MAGGLRVVRTIEQQQPDFARDRGESAASQINEWGGFELPRPFISQPCGGLKVHFDYSVTFINRSRP